MLRGHPHLQGSILGVALLTVAAIASPYALDSVRSMGTGTSMDEEVVVVADDPPTTGAAEIAAPPPAP